MTKLEVQDKDCDCEYDDFSNRIFWIGTITIFLVFCILVVVGTLANNLSKADKLLTRQENSSFDPLTLSLNISLPFFQQKLYKLSQPTLISMQSDFELGAR